MDKVTQSFKDQKYTTAIMWRAHKNFFAQFQKKTGPYSKSAKTLENVGMMAGADEPSHQNDSTHMG